VGRGRARLGARVWLNVGAFIHEGKSFPLAGRGEVGGDGGRLKRGDGRIVEGGVNG